MLSLQVLDNGSWSSERGILECNFFRLGNWDTVYCDDFLPAVSTSTGFVTAIGKSQDVWVPLLAKCFARLNGSYNAVTNGQFGDIYCTLTGGVAERLDHDSRYKPERIFQRISSALESDALIFCFVPDNREHKGLQNQHSYRVTGAGCVTQGGKDVLLVRLRSCFQKHGITPWVGPWSPSSQEWHHVEDSTVEKPDPEKNEFWMSLDDFLKHTKNHTICSLPYHMDTDGGDQLVYLTNFYGEWLVNKSEGPEITFTLQASADRAGDGWLPLFVQLVKGISKPEHRGVCIKFELFKLENHDRIKLTESHGNYGNGLQLSCFYRATAGSYMVQARTREPVKVQQDFLIRIYSPTPLADLKE
ncbi:calpain-1 catalytic subunit-like [Gigantopelta aegis]|uniref:calpain-1 catalytic subunit-like n=1 Tax=Gigantopelta aegis TaxID=1735272 RepID=UPI001B889BD1|nr:calpain-1 catalytic subunit-like [Gigantopelta aegis]